MVFTEAKTRTMDLFILSGNESLARPFFRMFNAKRDKETSRKEVLIVTRNQIEYQRNVESQRANRVGEDIKRSELEESHRHNVTSEEETERHNRRGEDTDLFKATTVDAHYRRLDDAELQKLAETIAHNRVNELQGEAKIKYESKLGFEQLKNQIVQAIIRAGGTWGAAYGVGLLSMDELTGRYHYDPFSDVVGFGDVRASYYPSTGQYYNVTQSSPTVGATSVVSGSGSATTSVKPSSTSSSGSSSRDKDNRTPKQISDQLRKTSDSLGTRDVFKNVTTDVVLTPSGISPSVSTNKGTVEDLWYM